MNHIYIQHTIIMHICIIFFSLVSPWRIHASSSSSSSCCSVSSSTHKVSGKHLSLNDRSRMLMHHDNSLCSSKNEAPEVEECMKHKGEIFPGMFFLAF